jgi:hypothetical protein
VARTRRCPPAVRLGRLQKAAQLFDAAVVVQSLADEDGEIADAYVTLCVHAGIAASDVICCARLGEHAQGENHGEAVELLGKADKDSSKHLRTLFGMKTKAGYGYATATADACKRASRFPLCQPVAVPFADE